MTIAMPIGRLASTARATVYSEAGPTSGSSAAGGRGREGSALRISMTT
jgi:hypothetical protein